MTPHITNDMGRMVQSLLNDDEPETIVLTDKDRPLCSAHPRLEKNITKIVTVLPFIAQGIGELKQLMKEHSSTESDEREALSNRVCFLERWLYRVGGAAGIIGVIVGGIYFTIAIVNFAKGG